MPPPPPHPPPGGQRAKGHGRTTERFRAGVNGGRERFGDSGGQNRNYYRAYYTAKGQGEMALQRFLQTHGPPPSRGGKSMHPRQ